MTNVQTIRFRQIVEKCGQPEAYTLWVDPSKDPTFRSALRENRVMTVHQATVGSAVDSGEVGYHRDKHGELLIFPKSLEAFVGKRIVGIKYDLLKQAPAPKAAKARGEHHRQPEPDNHAPTPKVIEFPRARNLQPTPSPVRDSAKELHAMKKAVRKALDALAKDRPVAAYKILERLV